MRPGQTAPECRVEHAGAAERPHASMRPGQTAPECDPAPAGVTGVGRLQ